MLNIETIEEKDKGSAVMKLPELNLLAPNKHTIFKKLVEEISECNTALELLMEFEYRNKINLMKLNDKVVTKIRLEYKEKINDLLGEIMDIAQVCESQLNFFESKGKKIDKSFEEYIIEDINNDSTVFYKEDNCRYVYIPVKDINKNLQSTMNNIIFNMGSVAQLGKFTGDNGEIPIMCKKESDKKHIEEMFNIIRNCFNLLHIMEYTYDIDIQELFCKHIDKLKLKGYCK